MLLIFLIVISLVNVALIFNKTVVNLMSLVLLMIVSCIFLFIHQNTEFLMYAYLIVYVGAIMVMFLFVVMTIDVKKENAKNLLANSASYIFLASNALTTIFFYITEQGADYLNLENHYKELIAFKDFFKKTPVEDVFIKTYSNHLSPEAEERLLNFDNSGVFGEYMFQKHAVVFILAALVLLLAMVIAIIICSVFADKRNVIKGN